LLAKNVNDNACIQYKRGVFEFFASRPQAGTRSYNGRRRLTEQHYPTCRGVVVFARDTSVAAVEQREAASAAAGWQYR